MPKANTKKNTTKAASSTKKNTPKTAGKRSTAVKETRTVSSKEAPKQAVHATTQTSKVSAKERAQKVTATLGNRLRQPRYFVPVIIIVVVALLYLFRSAFVVAIVNGQPITRGAYNQQLEAQAGKQVMNALVTQALIEQEASRQHITVSQSELDAQVKSIQDQLAKQGQTLDSALAAQGMTRDDFMTQLRLQALVKKLLASKIKVTDQEVNDYISKNQDSLPTGLSQSELKAQVQQQLEQQKLSQQAQALVQQLQQKAKITYFTNY